MVTKNKKRILILWIVGNIILTIKYIFDSMMIKCEPCPTTLSCPPCQTVYMKNIGWYLLIWNLVLVLIRLISRARPRLNGSGNEDD